MKREITKTEDGSATIYLPEIDEHYHSIHGAIQESTHVYIENGLLQTNKKQISIFEIGFGTGLNAFLTYGYARKIGLIVNYLSIEKYPLTAMEFNQLNYSDIVFQEYKQNYIQLHQAQWNKPVVIDENFTLEKIKADWLKYEFTNNPQFDLVYYDAFAPSKQAEMWEDHLLKKVADCVSIGGTITTYCAKGSVRRAWTAAGFLMERLPGPIGKKEIIRGKKTIETVWM
jgi:tRNA U34 5-methylaminomethyl-2-thiouridine-forming methyltransferase MnmC